MLLKLTNTLDGLIDDVPTTTESAHARVILLGSKSLDLSLYPNARGIFRVGVGAENVPWDAARARGIRVGLPSAATAEIIYEETAAFACYLILRMAYADVGTLQPWVKCPRRELVARTLLVVGTGNIGRRVVEKMRPFMRVLTYDAAVDSPDVLPSLLPKADVVSLHVPLNDATRDLLSTPELAMLRDGAAIVNTGRGKLVNEQALAEELRRGRLRAAFDVFWQEPYTGALASLPPDRFFMTPHVASTSQGFLEGLAADLRIFIDSLEEAR